MNAADSHTRTRERGTAFALVLMVAGLLSALATGLAVMVRLDTSQQAAEERLRRNFFAAEAGVNRGIARARNIFLDYNVPNGSDFALRNFLIGPQNVGHQLAEVPGNPTIVTLPPGELFAGLNSILYRYIVTSDAMGPNGREARLRAQFDINNIPLFQFLAFYEHDLEILPGPDMLVHGRIHSNADLYLNANNSFRVEDAPPQLNTIQVSAVGGILRGRKDSSTCGGLVVIDKLEDGPDPGSDLDPLELPCGGGGTRRVDASELAAWKGSLKDGVDSILPPQPGGFEPVTGIYWQNADLRVVLNLDGTMKKLQGPGPALRPIEVQRADGSTDPAATARLEKFMLDRPGKLFYNDLPSCPGGDESCADQPLKYTPPFALASLVYRRADDGAMDPLWTVHRLDYRRGGFFNNREKGAANPDGRWIYLLNLDLQALLDWNRAQVPGLRLFDPNDASNGGLVVFLSVRGPASAGINNYGVRVFDSAALGFDAAAADPTGITVVSDQAIYVQGNYNSVQKAPAALMGDSLNVLSQAWEASGNDRKSAQSLSSRPAVNTTINAGFLAGVDTTSPGNYNGGLENYPRFHETWSGVTLTYRGSFVSLGEPQHVNGPWCGTGGSCNIYDPPARNWDYELLFDDAAWLPPMTPRIIYVQQTFFGQEFR